MFLQLFRLLNSLRSRTTTAQSKTIHKPMKINIWSEFISGRSECARNTVNTRRLQSATVVKLNPIHVERPQGVSHSDSNKHWNENEAVRWHLDSPATSAATTRYKKRRCWRNEAKVHARAPIRAQDRQRLDCVLTHARLWLCSCFARDVCYIALRLCVSSWCACMAYVCVNEFAVCACAISLRNNNIVVRKPNTCL